MSFGNVVIFLSRKSDKAMFLLRKEFWILILHIFINAKLGK